MLITIIIPVYNRAKTLPECLDSIINQKYSEFECLLIDDGSCDDSLKVCKEYADKDSRFRVFHKTNGGVGSARNLGLENAKGEWVAFVDSDDIIAPNHLSQFATAIQEYPNVDILFCGCQYVCNGKKPRPDHTYSLAKYDGKKEIKHFFAATDILQYMYACDRIYRRGLIKQNDMRFDTTLSLSEDRLFCYQFLKYAKGVATVPEATYIINEEDNNKLSQRWPSEEMCINRYHKLSVAMQELIEYYQIYDNNIMPFWKYNYILLLNMLNSLYNVKGNIFSAVKRQRYYFIKYFDFDFYNKMKDIPELKMFMSNAQARRVLNMQFFSYDLHIMFNYILNRLHIR